MSKIIGIDHLQTWVGNQDSANDTITSQIIQRFCATLGSYTELASPLPLGIHWCLAQPAAAPEDLGVDGHPAKGGFLPAVPLPRRMWAAGNIQFRKPLAIDTLLVRNSTIADVVLKQSASSGPLVFVEVDHTYARAAVPDEILIADRQTLVYRQPSAFKPAAPPEPHTHDKKCLSAREISPDSLLLFRYSALTFNGHRIHYDQSYATSQEGYPGLVVQGPLIATLLMNLAQASRPGDPMREFTFRSTAPAFVDEELQFLVEDGEATTNERPALTLTARSQRGALIMTARAQF